MALDIKELASLIKTNGDLVNAIRTSALSVQSAANAVEAARLATAQAVGLDGASDLLSVGRSIQDEQSELLRRIVEMETAIHEVSDNAALVNVLRIDLATLYFNLANTQDASITSIIQFTADERVEIGRLVRAAELDTAHRKLMASVLNAAVNVSKAALKVAATIVAL